MTSAPPMSTGGVGGFGRYEDDPEHIGCLYAKNDMTVCAARDGRLAEVYGCCVGYGDSIADAFAKFTREATARFGRLIVQVVQITAFAKVI